jgi:hypothetical protein
MDYLIPNAYAAAHHLNKIKNQRKFDIREYRLLFGGRFLVVVLNGDPCDLPDDKLAQIARAEGAINKALIEVGTVIASICPVTGRISITQA